MINEIIPLFMNIAIIAINLVVVIVFCRYEGNWSFTRVKYAFRFFTTLSNVLCAISALCICLFRDAYWAFLLKYVGTVAVTVTMLTVIFFLGPSYGYKKLFSGTDLFLHLVSPVLAIVSFCVFERQSMPLMTAMLGILPVFLYGILYLYHVIYASEEKRWEDFYGFNRGGKWPLAFALMLLGAAVICLVMFAVSKI